MLNLSVRREVLDAVGDFLGAVIVEFIHYRFVRNDKKPVWLKIDWLHEKLPYVSRSGLAKKLEKLEKEGHIVVRRGEGRHYHKLWFSPSPDMREACAGKGIHMRSGKVYYNPDMAEQHLEASVVYAAIINLVRIGDRQTRTKEERELGGVDDKLTLDYAKLAEGSGLSIGKVRKAVKWLIENGKIDAKNIFGNKRQVWVPPNRGVRAADVESHSSEELPSESYPHAGDEGDPER